MFITNSSYSRKRQNILILKFPFTALNNAVIIPPRVNEISDRINAWAKAMLKALHITSLQYIIKQTRIPSRHRLYAYNFETTQLEANADFINRQ